MTKSDLVLEEKEKANAKDVEKDQVEMDPEDLVFQSKEKKKSKNQMPPETLEVQRVILPLVA